ncbi:MAG TPA: NADH-quinone oxidoreductase subunit M [Rhodanobacteraceae bacterium]|nr:NADH-quinone oxidoreductase subunit M [Rhodanobacteraceae bacterium]
MTSWPILSLLIWISFGGAVAVLAAGDARPRLARWLALAIALVVMLLNFAMVPHFDASTAAMQFVEDHAWSAGAGIRYHLGVDGIALPLILLTTIITVLTIVGAWQVIQKRVHQYMAAILALNGSMIGVFCACDAILFYAFFEAMLIPMFLLIGLWGGPRRVYATLKFFIYTFFGSVFFLIALLYLYSKTGTFDIATLQALNLPATVQFWLFLAFLGAFAIKVPMWPVHTWLPDAHVEAPTGGSVILAAVMLKIGTYGLLRFSLPILPDATLDFAWVMIVLSIIAIIYIGYVAMVQQDLKKLIAYSSVSHMGVVTVGIFMAILLVRSKDAAEAAQLGISGAMVQMISHGFVSGALFTSIGVVYDRLHTREIARYGGLVNVMPWFACFWVLFSFANVGLPGTSGFVGEFMVILATFQVNIWVALGTAFTLIIGAAYTLWLVKRFIWGEVKSEEVAGLSDLNPRESFVLLLFALFVLALGLWPWPLTHMMDASIAHLVSQLV